MAANPLLAALKAKKPAFGAWITTGGLFHLRTVAQASPHLSWLMIDCEHGLIPLVPGAAESIATIHSAAPQGGPSALVRIPATGVSTSTSWQIKYALDAGARGVLVPMVSTPEKAKEIVEDCKFPPAGRRGFGSPFTQGNWGLTVPEYLATANDTVSVMIQIENQEAVRNLDQIAAVEGIDVLFIGPYDLSLNLGYPTPSPDPHPEVEKVIQQILKASHDAGKKCAIYCISGAQAAKRAAEGFDLVNVTSDMDAMKWAISEQLAAAAK